MSNTPTFVGRLDERKELERCVDSNRSELVVVYGRRRVGKTFLIEHHFGRKFDFWYVGRRNIPTKEQLRQFGRALTKYSGERYSFSTWYEAFDALSDYLETLPRDKKKVLFIDEMPWIDRVHSNFVSAFEGFWNGWAMSRNDVVLIATGSATSWMRDKLVENKGGLHSRITSQLHISPFTLGETEQYLNQQGMNWDRYQVLQTYMVLGGVPFYYSLLDRTLSLAQNIDKLFFNKDGKLRFEFDELYNALFRYADRYIDVVKLLSSKRYGMTYKDLASALKVEGGQLTKILKNLERCDFVERWPQYGNKKREEVFRLTDFFTLFYYKFIHARNNREDDWWTKNSDSQTVYSWMGISFEMVCLRHYKNIKDALGLRVVSTEISTWHTNANDKEGTPGAQIDMIIDRADRIIHLCEIKFANAKFAISKDYEEKLRDRMQLFQFMTKNKKSIVNTFITTYGVANGMNRNIVHSEVTMDDLFQ